MHYLLYPDDFELKKARIEVDTSSCSWGRTNCYFGLDEKEETYTWVATDLVGSLELFWKEMMKTVDIVFSEEIQSKLK